MSELDFEEKLYCSEPGCCICCNQVSVASLIAYVFFYCQSNLYIVQRCVFMSKSRAAVQFAHTGCEAGRHLIAPSTTRHTHRQTDQNIPPHIQIQSGRFPPIPTAPFRVRLAHTHAQRSSHLGVTHVSTCLPLRRHLECNNSVRR